MLTVLLLCGAGALALVRPDQAEDTLPNFDRVLLLESTSETSANVSIGDLNGDGNLDIVLVKGRHWPLVDRVLLGDGKGHFPTAYDLGTAKDRSYSGRVVDIDGDGDLDVVISNDTPDAKLVYINDGKGHFRVGSAYGHPEWETRNASVADLNGDGQPDIVVANRSDRKKSVNYICFNKGKGRFDRDCVAFSHEPATTITPADFNGDGLIDLAVPYRDRGQSKVYLAGPKGSFSASHTIPFGPPDAAIRMAEAADLNGDGVLDLVTIDEEKGTAIYVGQRNGTFSAGTLIADSKITPYALAVRDLNGDGKPDIIVGNVDAPSTIHFNDGSGRKFVTTQFGDGKGTVYGFGIADLDRDGQLDIAVARSDAPNVVYFGAGAKSLAQRGSVPGGCRTPVSERLEETGCYLTVETQLGPLPAGPLFWHLYSYPTSAAAEAARGPRGTVAESFGKHWLYTIADERWRPASGERIAVIGPMSLEADKPYTARYMEAVFPPGLQTPRAGHRHSGPELWYVLTGAQCLETPDGPLVARAGQGAMVKAGPPMAISGVGTETRRAVLLVLHPTAEPFVTPATDWTAKGICPK